MQQTARSRHLVMTLFALMLSALIGAWFPTGVAADDAELQVIKAAIEEKDLHWQPRQYDREFAYGALLVDTEDSPSGPRPRETVAPDQLKATDLQASLDWRDGGWVSPVKDQLSCGSCWAFSSIAAVEALLAIQSGTPSTFLDLSEQILVSCATSNQGCSGGYMGETACFLKNPGSAVEQCYPYQGSNGSCSLACANWQASAYTIEHYQSVSRSVSGLKAALQYGPLAVGMDVFQDFDNYGSGIYEYGWGSALGGHAVLLVGYVDTPGQYGGGYFIVKNSWGTSWGEVGYFRIGYSQVTNAVSFGADAYRYSVSDTQPDPPPTPDATPVPGGDDYEPDDTSVQASQMVVGETQVHSITPAGDLDWVRFQIDYDGWVTIGTSADVPGDTMIYVFDAGLTLVASDDDSGPGLFSRVSDHFDAGTYYVLVKEWSAYATIDSYAIELDGPVLVETNIDLAAGWNLVSLPVDPVVTAVADVLESIAGQYSVVVAYDALGGNWLSYDPTLPGDATLLTLGHDRGFWVKMDQGAALSISGYVDDDLTQALYPGWNLVAYASTSTQSITRAFASISNALATVYGLDSGVSGDWVRYDVNQPSWANSLTDMAPGVGYWVHVSAPCELTIVR